MLLSNHDIDELEDLRKWIFQVKTGAMRCRDMEAALSIQDLCNIVIKLIEFIKKG